MIEFQRIMRDQIEYRFDPLTKEQVRINPARAKRLTQAESDTTLKDILKGSGQTCAFCPGHIEEKTPTFPEVICRGGRIERGETVIFPNLHPFGENHAVGTLSKRHFLDLDEFTVETFRDNLRATREYILSVYAHRKDARWPIWMWNYMPPSAGSILHPHVQILVENDPLPQQARLLEKSKQYFERFQKNYWEDLVSEEKKLDERYIFGNHSLSIIASFAPRGFNEIQFIFRKSSLIDLHKKEVDEFADSLTRALGGYKEIGIGSCNLITYSGPIDTGLDYYSLHATLFSRPYPKGVYTNDTGPMERGYDVWVIDTLPEGLAKRMKPFFV